MKKLNLGKIARLISWIIVCNVLGSFSAFITRANLAGWYMQEILKPSFTPPNWLFGPAWTLLFTLMGISLYLLLESKRNKEYKKALNFFIAQFILNIAWTFIFFGAKNTGLACLDIVLLLFLIILTIFQFAKVNKPAAYLLVPYLFWVSFASVLNYTVWLINL
jgi:translocator protein